MKNELMCGRIHERERARCQPITPKSNKSLER